MCCVTEGSSGHRHPPDLSNCQGCQLSAAESDAGGNESCKCGGEEHVIRQRTLLIGSGLTMLVSDHCVLQKASNSKAFTSLKLSFNQRSVVYLVCCGCNVCYDMVLCVFAFHVDRLQSDYCNS